MQAKLEIRNEPLMVNSLSQAARWLTEMQGTEWDDIRILDHVARMSYLGAKSDNKALTLLTVALPDEEIAGLYRLNGSSKRLVALRLAPAFHLNVNQTFTLLERGEFEISDIPLWDASESLAAHLEPHGKAVTITRNMVRISLHALKTIELAAGAGNNLHPVRQAPSFSEMPDSTTEDVDVLVALRRFAMDHGWDLKNWLPLARTALSSLDSWDGRLIERLRRGPSAIASQDSEGQKANFLSSSQLVDAFGDLTTLALAKALANGSAKWLRAVPKVPGKPGKGHETRWHPIEFVLSLSAHKSIELARFNSRFTSRYELAPWLEEWRERLSYGEYPAK
jgi:hypothetical protein